MLNIVYNGVHHTVRQWQVREGECALGEIEEPNFDFFPASEVRLKRIDLREIAEFSEYLENRLATEGRHISLNALRRLEEEFFSRGDTYQQRATATAKATATPERKG